MMSGYVEPESRVERRFREVDLDEVEATLNTWETEGFETQDPEAVEGDSALPARYRLYGSREVCACATCRKRRPRA